ncbi:MAG: hypothetical protein ACOVOX_04530 [Burkholderiaceae bacterium]|jgi:hypothetical protein
MSPLKYPTDILLPWPQSWERMQWEIAAWVAEHGDRSRVQVVWNETRLGTEVNAADFQAATTVFYQALQQRLGHEWQWQFEKNGPAGHRLVFGLATR